MSEFFYAAAALILLTVAIGLIRTFRGSGETDKLMSAQLVGSGGVAVLLLLSITTGVPSVIDVGLLLALLAAFASVAFVNKSHSLTGDPADRT